MKERNVDIKITAKRLILSLLSSPELKEIDVIVKGVGAGRESAIRSFVGKGVQIKSIKDVTPVPFNGPTRRKPRRV